MRTLPNTPNPPKPLYAVAGAADIVISVLRKLPGRLPTIAERAESAAANARSRFNDLSTELPAELRKLRDELPEHLHGAQARAEHYYAELAERGETAVARFRDEGAGTGAATGTGAGTGARTPAEPSVSTAEPPAAGKPAAAAKPTPRKSTPRKSTSGSKSAASKSSKTTEAPSTGNGQPAGKAGDEGTTA
ncbi:MAG: hypothetical protein ACODAF_00960 [Actinomycetota bacterium]